MVQAIGIFSGGLDSLLSARLLLEQGLSPTLLTFTSPFFSPDKARIGAKALGLTLSEVDIYDQLLPLVKNPPHGLGRHLNPCVDCHTLMLRQAGQLLAATSEPGFLFSGEVLGQRPMSQNPRAMKIVAEGSGHAGRVLRPLSAQLMPITEAEEKGWVDRERLLDLSGRSRRPQMDLAERFGLPIPTPAGGCLLTDARYCRRLGWLLEQPQSRIDQTWPPPRLAEIIRRGRIFTAEPGQWLIVGRNQADNQALEALTQTGDMVFHLEGLPGPTVLWPRVEAEASPKIIEMGRHLAAAYGDHGQVAEVTVRVTINGQEPTLAHTPVTSPADWIQAMII